MLESIFNRKYLNPTNLAEFQDNIISKPGINLTEVDSYIGELNRFDILFQSFLGLNGISNNNLFIRQQLILSALYFMKKEKDKSKMLKEKADSAFNNLRSNQFYLEGFSYLSYVINAYQFYFRYVTESYGEIEWKNLVMMQQFYRNVAGPDGSILMTDTCFTDKVTNEDRVGFHNDLYSSSYLNNQTTFVFINHNKNINRLAKNFHVNYEFGHFCVFDKNKWQVLHPFYPGYGLKSKTDLKQSWNNNIICDGLNTKEPYWRFLPKKELYYDRNGSVHLFKIGDKITRKIEVLNNGIFVTDNGGDFSSFNLVEDCKFGYYGKMVEKIGYHSPERGKIETHRRIELSGDTRIFWMGF
jgi:hypothetical protein